MRIFIRTFNNKINSKTGSPLPPGQYRGTPEWIQFQDMLIECLQELGHSIEAQPENPLEIDKPHYYDGLVLYPSKKRIYVHQCKRDKPEGDLFWMQMHMRELFTIDTNGWGADHSKNDFKLGEVDGDKAREFCEYKSNALLQSGISKCEQPQKTDETPENFILVPVQIPRDYTIKYHSPITVKYFIESVQAWAIETETQVCFKMHPHNKGDYDLHKVIDDAQQASGFVQKVEGNIHELIRRSSGLFVINSGTGFEALVHGKPVCTFGQCDYSKVSFNADIRRLDEARDFLYAYTPEFQLTAWTFVYWYYTQHGYDVNSPDTKERLLQYLKENL